LRVAVVLGRPIQGSRDGPGCAGSGHCELREGRESDQAGGERNQPSGKQKAEAGATHAHRVGATVPIGYEHGRAISG
jgi:hypothetical protein